MMQIGEKDIHQEYNQQIGAYSQNSSFFIKKNDFDEDNITIYVYQPCVRIKHIKLNIRSCISILARVYPEDSTYIFKGQILDISKTFFDYQITNENKIVSISPQMMKHDSCLVEKWIQMTNDYETFEERLNIDINKNSRREIARIKDLKFIKFEIKRKKLDRFLRSHPINKKDQNEHRMNIMNNEEKLNLSYEPINSPLTEPLPIIW